MLLPARLPIRLAVPTLLAALSAGPAAAAALELQLSDAAGRPLADAVALLEPAGGRRPPVRPMADVQIAQAAKRFNPRVTVVTVGTAIDFPNFDTVRHHVYSFSKAKSFELKLYAGVPAQPVVFDKPGLAALGCNIHDRMAAWIVVTDTPWAARSGADGRVRLADVPAGDYRLTLWHPALSAGSLPAPQPLSVGAAAEQSLTFTLPVSAESP